MHDASPLALAIAIVQFLNLAITAWVIITTKNTQQEVKRNTRITREARDNAEEVKVKTNGSLTTLLQQLNAAAIMLAKATAEHRRARPKPRKRSPTKKRPRAR